MKGEGVVAMDTDTGHIKGCVAAFRSERPEMFNLIIDQTIHLYLVMARS